MAKKYGVSEGVLLQRANKERWKELREEAVNKSIIRTQQLTADNIASSAVKQEQARQLAIDVILSNLGKLKEMQGSRITTRTEDKKGNPVTVDFSLNDMVTALEKLQRMGGSDQNAAPVQVIIDV